MFALMQHGYSDPLFPPTHYRVVVQFCKGTRCNLKRGMLQQQQLSETCNASGSYIHVWVEFRKPVSVACLNRISRSRTAQLQRFPQNCISRPELNITQLILVIGTKTENIVRIKPFFWKHHLIAFLT